MIVEWFTFCYNEIQILPFVVDYWKHMNAHVTVYDNESNDGSYEFLKKKYLSLLSRCGKQMVFSMTWNS